MTKHMLYTPDKYIEPTDRVVNRSRQCQTFCTDDSSGMVFSCQLTKDHVGTHLGLPVPPTLLETAEAIVALRVKTGREDSQWYPGWAAALADLAAAIEREKAK